MKKKVVAAIVCSILFFSCVTVQQVSLNDKSATDIPIFLTVIPSRPYTEVKYFESSGSIFHRNKKLLKKLQTNAAASHVDALINLKFGYVFWWPYVSAVGIKYE